METDYTPAAEVRGIPPVTNVRLPLPSCGFRSGWATATVAGVQKRLYTSRSMFVDDVEHRAEVAAQFAAGEGEAI